ncbi:MAG: T9SS type B sorting domain-containing protein [Bacteroidales bacterium]
MKNRLRYLLFVATLLLPSMQLTAQVDTIFWFAAPDVDAGYGDSPIYLRISSVDDTAYVNVTMPAHPTIFYTFKLDPNSTHTINLTNIKDSLETPADKVANNGLKIESTGKISAYYDVVGTSGEGRIQNTEIFVLKGRYALGKKFYATIQNNLFNSPDEGGYSGFDIVATEDNTIVTIKPTQPLYVSHPAGVSYTVKLNIGQTYSARAYTQDAVGHPGGSLITSTKPVAVTVKDDCLRWSSGYCRDLTGDQIVPVDFIGTDYIVLKGYLDGHDQGVIFGTQDNTQIYVNGTLNSTVNAGTIKTIDLTNDATYIFTSKPAYLMHVSGFGCQLGAPILPSIECSGYDQISFTRSFNYPFFLNIMTKAGTEDAFTLNGNASYVTASMFKPVPNKTEWVYAHVEFNEGQIPVGTGNILKNSKGNFQMGLLNGSSASGSACYGYFSGFNQFNPYIIVKDSCFRAITHLYLSDENILNSVKWNFDDPLSGTYNVTTVKRPYHAFTKPGTYNITAEVLYACGGKTVTRSLTIPPDIVLNLPDSVKSCGDSVLLDPAPQYCEECKFSWSDNSIDSVLKTSLSGKYQVRATNLAGCSKIDNSVVYNPFDTWNPKKFNEFCTSDSVVLDALLPASIWSTGDTAQTIKVGAAGDYQVIAQKLGCIDTAVLQASERTLPEFELEDTISFCSNNGANLQVKNPGSQSYSYLWSTGANTRNAFISNTGIYSVSVKDNINCTTNDTVMAYVYSLPVISLIQDVIICAEDSVKLYDLSGASPLVWSTGETTDSIFVKQVGDYIATVSDEHCSNSDTIVVSNWPPPTVGFKSEEYFCKGSIHKLDGGNHVSYLWSTGETTSSINITNPGSYWVIIKDIYTCETRDDITAYEWELPEISAVDTMPNAYITISATNGNSPYTYSLDNGIFQSSPSFYPVDPGIYNLTVMDANGCKDILVLDVNDDLIEIPKYFSPNGDGINDTWVIQGLDSYPEAEIKIFDRYGKPLVSYNGQAEAWDGNYQKKPVVADDYWFIIDLKNRQKPFTGHVTIVR